MPHKLSWSSFIRRRLRHHWLNLKNRLLCLFLIWVGEPLLYLILRTCDIQVEGADSFAETVKEGPCLMMTWHCRLPLVISALKVSAPQFRYAAIVSGSRDGELLASIVDSYAPRAQAIRVKHTAKHQGLKNAIKALKENIVVVVTPDGPRGPRFKAKPGLIFAARATQGKIIPFSWLSRDRWIFKTWDLMTIPKPFSKVIIGFGPALAIANGESDSEAAARMGAELCIWEQQMDKQLGDHKSYI